MFPQKIFLLLMWFAITSCRAVAHALGCADDFVGMSCNAPTPTAFRESPVVLSSSANLADSLEDVIGFVQLGQTVVSTPLRRTKTARLSRNRTRGQLPGAHHARSAHRLRRLLAKRISRARKQDAQRRRVPQLVPGAKLESFGVGLRPKPARGIRRNSTLTFLVSTKLRATFGAKFANAVWPMPDDDADDESLSSRTSGAILVFSMGFLVIPVGTYFGVKNCFLARPLARFAKDDRDRLLYALAVMVLLGCSRGLVGGFSDTVIVVAEYYWTVPMSLVVCVQVFEAVLFFLAFPLWLHAVDYHGLSTPKLLVIGTTGCFYFNSMLSLSDNIAEALMFKSCAAIFQPALIVAQVRFCFDHVDGIVAKGFMWAGFVCEYISHGVFSTFALYYLDVQLDNFMGDTVDGWRWCLSCTGMVAGLWTLFTVVLIHQSRRLPAGTPQESQPLWDQAGRVIRAAGDAGGAASLWLLGLCSAMAAVLASVGIYRTIYLTYMGFDTREITFVRFMALAAIVCGYLLGRVLGKLNFEIRGLRGRVEVAAVSDACAVVAYSMFYLVIPYYTGFFTGVYDGLHTQDIVAYTLALMSAGLLGTWSDYALTEPMIAQILDASAPKSTPAGLVAIKVAATALGNILGPMMVGILIDWNGYSPDDEGIFGRLIFGWNAICFELSCGSVDFAAVFVLMIAHAWIHGRLCGGTAGRPAWLKDPFPTSGE